MMRRLSTAMPDFLATLDALLAFDHATDDGIERTVADILAQVRQRGDAAVLEYTQRFDGLAASTLAELSLLPAELAAAFDALPTAQRQEIGRAHV